METVLEKIFIDVVARDKNLRRDLDAIAKEAKAVAAQAGKAFSEGMGNGVDRAAASTRGLKREQDALKTSVGNIRNEIFGLRSAYINGAVSEKEFRTEMTRLKDEATKLAQTLPRNNANFRQLHTAAATAERGLATLRGEASRLGIAHQTQIALTNTFGNQLRTLGPAGGAAALGLQALGNNVDFLVPKFGVQLPAALQTSLRAITMLQVLAPAAIVVGLVALTKFADKAAETADAVDKGSQSAGLAAERFQSLRFAFDQSGISGDRFSLALESMNRRLGLAAEGNVTYLKAYKQLGVAVRDSNGAVRENADIFDDLFASISKLPSAAEQAAVASVVFGDDVGKKLVPIIRQGVEGLADLEQKARDLGIVISGDAVRALVNYKDEMAALRQQFQTTGVQITASFLPVLTQLVIPLIQNEVVPLLQSWAEKLGDVGDRLVDTGAAGVAFREGIADAVTPVLQLVNWLRVAGAELEAFNTRIQLSGARIHEVIGGREQTWLRDLLNLPEPSGGSSTLFGHAVAGRSPQELAAELAELTAESARLRELAESTPASVRAAIEGLAERTEEAVTRYREAIGDSFGEDGLAGAVAKASRTVGDVFDDLAKNGTIEVRKAAAGVITELEGVESRAGLVARSIDELFSMGLTGADAQVQYLLGRYELLTSAAAAYKQEFGTGPTALDHQAAAVGRGLVTIPVPQGQANVTDRPSSAALAGMRGQTAAERAVERAQLEYQASLLEAGRLVERREAHAERKLVAAHNEYTTSLSAAAASQLSRIMAESEAQQVLLRAANDIRFGTQEALDAYQRQAELKGGALDLSGGPEIIINTGVRPTTQALDAIRGETAEERAIRRAQLEYQEGLLEAARIMRERAEAEGDARRSTAAYVVSVRYTGDALDALARQLELLGNDRSGGLETIFGPVRFNDNLGRIAVRDDGWRGDGGLARAGEINRQREALADAAEGFRDTIIGSAGQFISAITSGTPAGVAGGTIGAAGSIFGGLAQHGPALDLVTKKTSALFGIFASFAPLVGSVISDVVGGFAEWSGATEQLKTDIDGLAASMPLLSRQTVEAFAVTKTERVGGLLGLLGLTKEVLDQEATQAGVQTANGIASGIAAAIRGGGDIGDAIDGMILDAVIESAILSGPVQAAITALATAINEALEDGVITDAERNEINILGDTLEAQAEAVADVAGVIGENAGKRFAESFSDAMASAISGASSLEEFRESLTAQLDSIILNALIDTMLNAAGIQAIMAGFGEQLAMALEDGVISPAEQANLRSFIDQARQIGEEIYRVADDLDLLPKGQGNEDMGGRFGEGQIQAAAPQISLSMPSAAMTVTAAQPWVQAANVIGQAADRLMEAATLIRDALRSGGNSNNFYAGLTRGLER